nr:histidine kinase [Terriglobales bacterium]
MSTSPPRTNDAVRLSRSALEDMVRERTTDLRNLSQRLLKLQDEERRRIARDLHDSVGQILTALKIDAWMLEKQF